MYAVSEEYLTAIKEPYIRTKITGTIGGVDFTDENILEGSFSITNQNSGTDNVQIGQVYIGQLQITLRGLTFSRYSLDGYEIVPYFWLKLADDSYEKVPLGHYFVNEANYTATGIVITAYDGMSKMDKTCSLSVVAGKPYSLAKTACEACFQNLATTEAEFSGFANGGTTLTLYQDGTDIETWRDFISWVAQACGCYVTINRDGDVEFRAYGTTIVDTLDMEHRFTGGSFSDYTTQYTGLYCTNIAGNTMDYYGLEDDSGLTYSLGSNPFLQYGTADYLEETRRAILSSLAVIDYVPFKAETVANPMYDLGDILSFPDGIGDADALFCVNKITWSYHKAITLEGVGENPALTSAQSKTDKNLAGLASKISDDTMHYYDFMNFEDLIVADGETQEIINLDYVTSKDTHIDFHAELRATIDSTEDYTSTDESETYTEHDVTGTVSYYLNDELVAYFPLFTEADGIQLRHLLYFWQSSANIIGNFCVELTAEGGSITIPRGDLHAYWAGQGILGEIEDTNPGFEDSLPAQTLDLTGTFEDEFKAEFVDVVSSSFSDEIAAQELVGFSAFTDSVTMELGMFFRTFIGASLLSYTVDISDTTWVASEDDQYIQTCDVYGVTAFYSYTGDALSYSCSFDSGETWQGWNGTEWEDDLEMTYTTLSALTSTEFGEGPIQFKITFDSGESLEEFYLKGGHIEI